MRTLLLILIVLIALAAGMLVATHLSQLEPHSTVNLTVQVDRDELAVLSPEDKAKAMAKITGIINLRLGLSNLMSYDVKLQGGSLLRVAIECFPQQDSCRNPDGFRDLLERRGVLEFKRVLASGSSQGTELSASNAYEIVVHDSKGLPYLVVTESLISGLAITSARAQQAPGQKDSSYFIALTLSEESAQQFARLLTESVLKARGSTPDNPGDQLAIILDGVVQSVAFIDQTLVDTARIDGWRALQNLVISGQHSLTEANELAIVLGSGALPLPIKVIEGYRNN
jgi:preprotein translocase subunit SecD